MEFAPQQPKQALVSLESFFEESFTEVIFSDVKFVIVKNKETGEKVFIFFPGTSGTHKNAYEYFLKNHKNDAFEVVGGGILDYDKDEGVPEEPSQIEKDKIRITRTKSDTLNIVTLPEDHGPVREQAEKYFRSLKL